MVRSPVTTLLLMLLAVASCTSNAPAPLVVARIRSIRIIPANARACPGARIEASYVALLDNDSSVAIEPGSLSALDRDGIGAAPERGGAWSTERDPLVTARSGFVLRAQLHDKPSISSDTVVLPDYTCPQDLVTPGADVTVRVGELRSPFYDSLVVIAVTVNKGTTTHILVDGAKAAHPAVQLWAAGETGRPGIPGQTGGAGAGACSIGSDGGDGTPGHPGGKGGSFTIDVEAGHRDLLGFVATHNSGGAGGPGGAAGSGGQGGPPPRPGAPPCDSDRRDGFSGHNGPSGASGPSGPPNVIREIPLPSLWQNSPDWSNARARAVLAAMLDETPKSRPR